VARTTIASPGFLDRLGDRVVVTDRTGGDLEVLRLRPELTADPAFETGLKARAEQLVAFQHRAAARVRGISRLPGNDGRLAIVSDVAKGWRLSEVLQAAEHEGRLIHTGTVLFLLRQVASVAAALQAIGPDIAHGALGPERVVLSPAGRVLVVEYVLGAALEHLPALPADRMWKELRLAVLPGSETPRFGQHTDVLQLGITALSLVHNRLLKRDEYPGKLAELLDTATESQVTGARQPLGRVLRDWLEHALGMVPGASRWTMADAQHGLDRIVSAEGGYFSTPVGLEPLLQSVERFFTVPAADTMPAPEPLPSTTVRIRPRTEATPPTPVPPPAPAAEERPHPPPPVLTLVETRTDFPVALPPATELIARTLDEGSDEHAALNGDATAVASESLIVTSSPLAEFAAERELDPFPVPSDPVPDPLASRASLWPVLPRPTPPPARPDAPPEVAPVADMLSSVDRPSLRRRSGWSGEAWLSRSTDRQPSGARTVVPGSGATESRDGSGPVPRAVTPARLLRSGGPATAAVLRPNDAVPAPDASPAPEDRPAVKDPSLSPLSPFPDGHPPAPVQPPHTVEKLLGGDGHGTTAVPARPMFGFSADDSSHEAAKTDERPRARRRRSLLWPAAAALVILCGGGFAAWKFLAPSSSAAAAEAARAVEARPPVRQEAKAPAPAPPPTVQPTAATTTAPAAETRPAMGSLRIASPIVVSVSEKGQALGTSAAPISLAAGPHVLDFSSEEFGFQATRPVEVRADRVTRTELAMPNGSVNINATPWAEVLVDGQRVGETPLGNIQLPIGPHEVRFRHPQLGEQVRTVMITTGTPGRLSVDMKQ
jgi:hypothetical protein